MKRIFAKTFDWILFFIASLVVIFAVLLSIARVLVPHLTQYQPRIEQWVTQAIQRPVHIGQMQAGWSGFEPEFQFKNVAILDPAGKKNLLTVKQLNVGISLLKSLIKWRIQPGTIEVKGMNLAIHQDPNGKITVNGLTTSQDSNDASSLQDAFNWLLSPSKILLENVNVTWYGKNKMILPLKNIKFEMTNTLLSHQLLGVADLQQATPMRFRFVLNINASDPSSKDFKAELYLRIPHFVAPNWLQQYPIAGVKILNAQGNMRIWATWGEQHLQNLQTLFSLNNINLKTSKRNLIIPQLSGNVLWQRQPEGGWALAGNRVGFIFEGMRWSNLKFSYRSVPAQFGPQLTPQSAMQILQLNYVDLQSLKNLLLTANILSSAQTKTLNQINPSGELTNLTITHFTLDDTSATLGQKANTAKQNQTQPKNNLLNQFSLVTAFSNLSWQRWQKVPGATNLTGVIQWTPTHGALALASTQSTLNFGRLFAMPLPVDTMELNAEWQHSVNGWEIYAKDFSVQNALVSVRGDVRVLLPADHSSPIMDLLAGFNILNPSQALQYMPDGIMSPALITWLKKAIVAGDSGSGSVLFSGPLAAFPFDHNDGRFVIDSQIKNATLHYRDQWPDIQHLDADLDFDDSSMSINASSGQIFNAKIKQAQANIPELRQAVVQVNGNVTGDLNDGLQFLQQSPLNDTIGKQLAGFQLSGPMNLDLQLTIPIKTAGVKVLGNVALQKGDLKMPQWWNLHASQLQGNLQFTENSFSGNLQGQLFDNPLTANITTLNAGKPNSLIQIDFGQLQATLMQLQQRFNLPSSPYVTGELQYHPILQFGSGASTNNGLIINSDLQGINIALPDPLGKKATDAVPSQLQILFGGKHPLRMLFTYGQRASAALGFQQTEKGLALANADIELGNTKATFQNQPGIVLGGYLKSFDWDTWKTFITPPSKSTTESTEKSSALALRKVDMSFDSITGFGKTLTKTHLILQPDPRNWNVQIDNAQIAGQITIPKQFPRGTLNANLQRLYLPETTGPSTINLLPSDMPELDVTINDFQYGDKKYGTVTLAAEPDGNTLDISNLTLKSPPNYNLTASGEWRGTKAGQTTNLSGDLTAQNLGAALSQLGITKSLVGGQGTASFDLNWNDAPFKLTLNKLNGDVKLRFNEGRIINLSKTTETELGLGRVLNLFSLQTLPRRLRLDFSDLTDTGFSFDIMKGDFNLKAGNVYTTNAYLDGPVARVTMKGRIGLATQDYDLDMVVSPYVTSTLPVVATIFGGPIAGAATWLASKIFTPVMRQIIAYSYHVTGSWSNPSIMSLTAPKSQQQPNPSGNQQTVAPQPSPGR